MKLASDKEIEEAGMTIVSGAVDPSLARDFGAELVHAIPSRTDAVAEAQRERETVARHSAPTGLVHKDRGMPAVRRVLELLGLEDSAMMATFNYQPPRARGLFHVDATKAMGLVRVFHGSDGVPLTSHRMHVVSKKPKPTSLA